MVVEIRSLADVQELESRVKSAAESVPSLIAQHTGDGMALLRRMRFEPFGRHPLEDRQLNFIEQVNQTFTILVALRATRLLLDWHPEAEGFKVVLGPRAGTDITSRNPSVVAAEVFAAVTPASNDKLRLDCRRVCKVDAKHRYVFLHCPGHSEGPYTKRIPVDGIKVWAVDV